MKITLEYLLKKFLINSNIGERQKINKTETIAISDLGLYYMTHILVDLNYYKFIIVDTYIKEKKFYKDLSEEYKKFQDISNKIAKNRSLISCIKIFLKYLTENEEDEIKLICSTIPKSCETPIKPIMPSIIEGYNHSKALELKVFSNKEKFSTC